MTDICTIYDNARLKIGKFSFQANAESYTYQHNGFELH